MRHGFLGPAVGERASIRAVLGKLVVEADLGRGVLGGEAQEEEEAYTAQHLTIWGEEI